MRWCFHKKIVTRQFLEIAGQRGCRVVEKESRRKNQKALVGHQMCPSGRHIAERQRFIPEARSAFESSAFNADTMEKAYQKNFLHLLFVVQVTCRYLSSANRYWRVF